MTAQRVVTLRAGNLEMFAVIELAANEPAIRNDRLRDHGRAVL